MDVMVFETKFTICTYEPSLTFDCFQLFFTSSSCFYVFDYIIMSKLDHIYKKRSE